MRLADNNRLVFWPSLIIDRLSGALIYFLIAGLRAEAFPPRRRMVSGKEYGAAIATTPSIPDVAAAYLIAMAAQSVSGEHDPGEPDGAEVVADGIYLRDDVIEHTEAVEQTEVCERCVDADRGIATVCQRCRQEVLGLIEKVAENPVQTQHDGSGPIPAVSAGRRTKQRVDLVLADPDAHDLSRPILDVHMEFDPP